MIEKFLINRKYYTVTFIVLLMFLIVIGMFDCWTTEMALSSPNLNLIESHTSVANGIEAQSISYIYRNKVILALLFVCLWSITIITNRKYIRMARAINIGLLIVMNVVTYLISHNNAMLIIEALTKI